MKWLMVAALAASVGFNSQYTVLYFVGRECPNSNAHVPRMIDLSKDYPQVSFVAVYSNRTDSAEKIEEHRKKFGIPFKTMKDEGHALADKYKVESVPTAVLIDSMGNVLYRGPIDDHKVEEFVTSRDLRKALDEVLAGKPVSTPETAVEG